MEYTDDDVDSINNKWQPTGTYHLSAEERAKQEKELDDLEGKKLTELER